MRPTSLSALDFMRWYIYVSRASTPAAVICNTLNDAIICSMMDTLERYRIHHYNIEHMDAPLLELQVPSPPDFPSLLHAFFFLTCVCMLQLENSNHIRLSKEVAEKTNQLRYPSITLIRSVYIFTHARTYTHFPVFVRSQNNIRFQTYPNADRLALLRF